jgi:Fe2+ or Zn2+ uptake regulation protein
MRRAARKRKTRQLEQVFAALRGDHTHPFAREIYRRVHKKLPGISLATVYRNLHNLVEEGKIRTLLVDEQGTRFDPETREHDHFICERCGRVVDLFLQPRARRVDLTSLAKHGYVVTTHDLSMGCVRSVRLDVGPPGAPVRRHESPSETRGGTTAVRVRHN